MVFDWQGGAGGKKESEKALVSIGRLAEDQFVSICALHLTVAVNSSVHTIEHLKRFSKRCLDSEEAKVRAYACVCVCVCLGGKGGVGQRS